MMNRRNALPVFGVVFSTLLGHAAFAAEEIRGFSVEEKSKGTFLLETRGADGTRTFRALKLVDDVESERPYAGSGPRAITVGLGGAVTFGQSLSSADSKGASPDLNGKPVYTPQLKLVFGDEFRESPYKVAVDLGPSVIRGKIGEDKDTPSNRNADFKADLDVKVYGRGDGIRPYGGAGASIDPYGDLRYFQGGVSLQLAEDTKLDVGALVGQSGTAGTINGAEPILVGPSVEFNSRVMETPVGVLVSLRALLSSKKAAGAELTGKIRYPLNLPFLAEKNVKAELEAGVAIRGTQQEGSEAKTGSFTVTPQGGALLAF